MDSVVQTIGGLASASAYNALRVDVITAISTASGAAADAATVSTALATHKATAASVHGLGAGVSVLGSKQAGGLRIEYAATAITWTHTGGVIDAKTLSASWSNSFSNIYGVATDCSVFVAPTTDANISAFAAATYSITSATKTIWFGDAGSGTAGVRINWLGIGS